MYNQNTESIPFSLIKQHILDNYYQTWYAEIKFLPEPLLIAALNMVLPKSNISISLLKRNIVS